MPKSHIDTVNHQVLQDFDHFIRDPVKRIKQLVRKITYSGETDLSKDDLKELKQICKASSNDFMVIVHKECMKHLHKDHSQVRVTTVKLIDYLFQKSHTIRSKLLDEFDLFLELTLAITHKAKVQLKLPPPKKYAALLQELAAKCIHRWKADFGEGYEKLRYAHRFLREHRLVDFSSFQVNTREQQIKQQELAEKRERILTRAIENRIKDFRELKPEIEGLIAQIESLIDIIVPDQESQLRLNFDTNQQSCEIQQVNQHGDQGIDIEFSPYIEIRKTDDNKDIVQNLRELKRELLDGKMIKLVAIEKTVSKRSEQLVSLLREIIDLKSRASNVICKLSDLSIISVDDGKRGGKKSTLDEADSSPSSEDDDDFEEVPDKDDLETYIPKRLRSEYGLEAIDPRELNDYRRVSLTDDAPFFDSSTPIPSTSTSGMAGQSNHPSMACNVRLESGQLCPRRDKVKCPFHGKIIERDHLGVPVDEKQRLDEQNRFKMRQSEAIPDWQDPQLLAEIKAATGVDLEMPKRTDSGRLKKSPNKSLANPRTCDLTPKKRLEKKLKLLLK